MADRGGVGGAKCRLKGSSKDDNGNRERVSAFMCRGGLQVVKLQQIMEGGGAKNY